MDQVNTFINLLPPQFNGDRHQMISITAAAALLYLSYKLVTKKNTNHKQGLKEIPSPGGSYPYFGHMLSIGTEPSRKIAEWHKEAGHIIKVRMGIQTWVMIDDPRLAHKVFITNGVNASHRPHQTFTDIYSHNGRGLAFSQPEKHWKDVRAAVISIISQKYVDTNYIIPIQREAVALTERLIKYSKESENGIDPVSHLHLNSMNIIYMSAFGKRFDSIEDEEFRIVSESMIESLRLAGPENDISGFFPIFAIVEYFTGKRQIMKDYVEKNRDPLYTRLINEAMKKEEPNLVKEIEKYNFDDHAKLVILSDLIIAGTDTVSITLSWVFSLMCNYPEVQSKAAAEIDQFIKLNGRIPLFSDRDSLPYCVSMLKECMRFKPTTPFGLPHKANEDILVDDYLIPKGAIIFSSMESMHMNPEFYTNPEVFYPERFSDNLQLMDSAAKGPLESRDHFNFGWGRRMCAGIYMAEAELFTTFVHVISRCTIEPIRDSNGKEEFPDIDRSATVGPTIIPVPYKVKFVERTQNLF